MTRKDFELIAEAMRWSLTHGTGQQHAVEQHRLAVQNLANSLRSTNPRFDVQRFVAACGDL